LTLVASFSGWGKKNLGMASADSQTSDNRLAASGIGHLEIGRWIYTIFHRQMEARNLVLPVAYQDFVIHNT
jgi:hypothetical protein